jgi:hypothetical protein
LKNIRPSTRQLTVLTNGGTQVSTMLGDIPNFGSVWFNPASIANILSLAAVRKVCRVTMDTAVEAAMFVHKLNGDLMKFEEFHSGLYYHDTAASVQHTATTTTTSPPNTSETVNAYALVTTVAANKAMFTRREIEGADKARELYRMIGRPSEKSFQEILSKVMIHNCPITAEDAQRALTIYGPDLATLKGKTTKRNGIHVPSITTQHLPPHILEHHRDVTLCADVFFVQGQRFHHTISRKIKFRTVAPVTNVNRATLREQTKAVIDCYTNRGFNITNIHADGAFECIREAVAPIILNINAADEHVGEVERSIRTIKERVRATVHGLPYKRLPREMIKGVVRFAVKSLNQFPAEDGISDVISPTSIMTGVAAPNYNHFKLEFGEYATVFEDNNPTNTNAPRTVDAVALHHTGNAQGDYFFMSLATGERISRRQYTKLPITQRVIDAVEGLAAAQGQPMLPGAGPTFEWGLNDPIDEPPAEPDDVGHNGGQEAEIQDIAGEPDAEEHGEQGYEEAAGDGLPFEDDPVLDEGEDDAPDAVHHIFPHHDDEDAHDSDDGEILDHGPEEHENGDETTEGGAETEIADDGGSEDRQHQHGHNLRPKQPNPRLQPPVRTRSTPVPSTDHGILVATKMGLARGAANRLWVHDEPNDGNQCHQETRPEGS